MSRNIFRVSILTIALLQFSCASRKENLKKEIESVLQKQEGTFAVAFKDLRSKEEILINEHDSFHAASTMKTPVMIEVFKQAAEGKFALTDSITITTEFKSIVDGSPFRLDSLNDSEQDLFRHVGEKRPLSDLVYRMIIKSSNLATNIIIDLVDATKVTETMRSMGAKDIQVLRGVEDSKAYALGKNNTTTAYDLMVIFEKIANGEAVNPEASKAMTNILLDQTYNTIIPAKLPQDVKVAHKTGWITGLNHDSAIVFLPDGRIYVLVLLSKDLKNEKAAIEAMATVSEMIYRFVLEGK